MTSSNLYLSKIQSLYSCPKKYWLTYHKKLVSKTPYMPFYFGAVLHKAIELSLEQKEIGIGLIHIGQSELDDYAKGTCKLHLDLVLNSFNALGVKVLDSERPIHIKLYGGFFHRWYIKTDLLAEFPDGVWVVDFKTTSGYGASIAKYYHTSMQTLSYNYIVKKTFGESKVKGTKIFVLPKTKDPKLFVEDIVLSDKDMQKAERFIETASTTAEEEEDKGTFVRRELSCTDFKGGDCIFLPICFDLEQEGYVLQAGDLLYKEQDPDEHLSLEKEVV